MRAIPYSTQCFIRAPPPTTDLGLCMHCPKITFFRKGCFRASVTGMRTAPPVLEKVTPPLSSTCQKQWPINSINILLVYQITNAIMYLQPTLFQQAMPISAALHNDSVN